MTDKSLSDANRKAGAGLWISVDDKLPEVGEVVAVYAPPTEHDWPGSVNISFDYICPDYEDWHDHAEHFEHWQCVAKPEGSVGPKQKAPYTHWMRIGIPGEVLPTPAPTMVDERGESYHRIPGLGFITDEDNGRVTLEFKDEASATRFMKNYGPSVDCDAMPLRTELQAPIDMVLHCPKCHLQHVDAPDERTPDWKNEPHRSHLCHGCGHIWRPADVPTNGVQAVKTTGKADSPIASRNESPAASLQSLGGDAGVSEEWWYDLASKHALADWNGPGYLGAVKAIVRDALSLTSTEKSDGWISFADRLPPDLPATDDPSVMVSPRVLVTNNIHAKTRTGRPANVWYVYPLRDESNDEWFAFDESVGKIYNLTHWFDPFASLPAAPKAAEKSGRSES